MGFLDFLNRPDQPVQDVSNAPMTQEQFVAQNPNYYNQETSNPDYDYMLYQMQQENAAKAAAEAQLQQNDPKAYYAQKSTDLANQLFTSFTNNGQGILGKDSMEAENTAQLEAIKKVDPDAYYRAMLHLDMQKAGWDAGQGKSNPETNARIQNNIQEALKVGVPPEQIQNYVKYDYGVTAEGHAKNIAQRQGQGAFLQGIEKVAPAFAAMITAGALAPAAGALEAGAVGAGAAGEIAGGSLYTGAGTFAGEGLGTAAELMGPTYGELGYTGLEAGQFGPTYGEMGYTGLNQGQAIAGADAISQSRQALDALNYANKAKNLIGTGSNLAKLLGVGGTTSGVGSSAVASGANAISGNNTSQQQIAQYLKGLASPFQAASVPGQIKMNQNPFTFNIPGQTVASEGMYDVSGINSMANALRKNNGTNS
jgi:hypothetical protein